MLHQLLCSLGLHHKKYQKPLDLFFADSKDGTWQDDLPRVIQHWRCKICPEKGVFER